MMQFDGMHTASLVKPLTKTSRSKSQSRVRAQYRLGSEAAMSTSSDKPPNPPTIIRSLSIFIAFSLLTSHLCCKDLFFFALTSCIESLFFSMCGYSGNFEAEKLCHPAFCFETRPGFICPSQKEGEGAAEEEDGTLFGANVIC